MTNCRNCGAPVAYENAPCRYCGSGNTATLPEEAIPAGPAPVQESFLTYAKVSMNRRIFGVATDLLLSFLALGFAMHLADPSMKSQASEHPLPAIIFLAYGLLKDGLFRGRSIGKILAGTMVVNTTTNKPCNVLNSVVRNGISYLLMMIPLVGFFLDLIVASGDPKGCKPGDRIAGTQVILAADYRP